MRKNSINMATDTGYNPMNDVTVVLYVYFIFIICTWTFIYSSLDIDIGDIDPYRLFTVHKHDLKKSAVENTVSVFAYDICLFTEHSTCTMLSIMAYVQI